MKICKERNEEHQTEWINKKWIIIDLGGGGGCWKIYVELKTYHNNNPNVGREWQMELHCSEILKYHKVSKIILGYNK